MFLDSEIFVNQIQEIFNRSLGRLNPKVFGVWGQSSQAPNTFGWNPPSQLVHGYHWSGFLSVTNQKKMLFSSNAMLLNGVFSS